MDKPSGETPRELESENPDLDELEKNLNLSDLPFEVQSELKEGNVSVKTLNTILKFQKTKFTTVNPRRSQLPAVEGMTEENQEGERETPNYGNTGNPQFYNRNLNDLSGQNFNHENYSNHHVPYLSPKYVPEIACFVETNLESLEEYFDRFEKFCLKKYGPDNQQWLVILETKLNDKFLNYFRLSGGNTTRYNIVKNQLIKYYNTQIELGTIQATTFSSVKYDKGTIHEYMAKLRYLFSKTYPSEDPETSQLLYEKFRDTLPEKARKLICAKYMETFSIFNIKMTFSSLENYVLSLESRDEILGKEQTYSYCTDNEERDTKIRRPKVIFRRSDMKNKVIKCDICHKVGHNKDNCYKTLKLCFNCGSSNHFVANCSEKSPNKERNKNEDKIIEQCQYCSKFGHTAKTCWFINKKVQSKTNLISDSKSEN